MSRYSKCRYQKKVKKIISEYSLIDWTTYLKREFIKLSEEITGISLYELLATKSELGLHEETVARPYRESNRQAESKIQPDEASTYNVHVNNIKGTTIVIIYRLSVRLRTLVIVFGHLCRSPPKQSIKRMFSGCLNVKVKNNFKE